MVARCVNVFMFLGERVAEGGATAGFLLWREGGGGVVQTKTCTPSLVHYMTHVEQGEFWARRFPIHA